MPLYVFKTESGVIQERIYSINDCPDEILLQNGQCAKKIITCPHIANSSSVKQKIKKQQTQKNIDAGNRGRSYWQNKFGGK